MQDVLKRLDSLEEKLMQLSQKIEYLKKENIMLIEENVKIKQEAEKIKLGNAIRQGGKDPNSGRDASANKNQEQMKKDLDKYIEEVDKCIALINNM